MASTSQYKFKLSFVAILFLAALWGCKSKEESGAAYLAHGKALYEQGNFTKATIEFRNALQVDPKDVESMYYLGLIAEQTGDFQKAFEAFYAVTLQDPKNIPAQLKLAHYALIQDDRTQVLETAALVISLDSKNAEAHALRAAVFQRQGKNEEATQEAMAALSADSTNMIAVSVLSGIKVAQGDTDSALKLLDSSIVQNPKEDGLKLIKLKVLGDRNDLPGSETVWRDLIAETPSNKSYKISLAQLLLSQNRQQDAEKVFRHAIATTPNDNDLKLLLVQFLFEERGPEAAEAELRAFVKAAPDEFAFLHALSALYAGTGKQDKAKEILTDIIGKDLNHPNTLLAKTDLARLVMTEGEQAQAQKLIAEVLTDDPKDNGALQLRAEIELSTGDIQASVTDLRMILGDNPTDKQALLRLIEAYLDGGEEQLAIGAYRSYLSIDPENDAVRVEFARHLIEDNKTEEAEKQIAAVLQRMPTFVPALIALVDLRILHKDWAGAVDAANRMSQIPGAESKSHTALGKANLAQGKFTEAILELNHAYGMSSGSSEARTMLIQALTANHQADQAIAILTKDAAKEPKDADAFLLLGDVYFSLNRLDDARKALTHSIEIRPNWDLPYLKLISLDVRTDRQEEAAVVARSGLKQFPNHVQLLLNLGIIEDAAGKFDAAREAYELVLKQRPRNAFATNNLAALIADAWPADKALLEYARRLAEPFRNSNDPLFLDTLGWVQYKLGNIDDAIGLLERSVQARPDLAQIRYHLGMAYKDRGDQAKARLELQQATASASAYRGLEDAKSALDHL